MSTPFSSGVTPVNTAAVITVRGKRGMCTYINDIVFSYNAAPTGGRLQIVGQTSGWQYDMDVTVAGADSLGFSSEGLEFQTGEDVVLTLAAAGAAVVGKVNCGAYWKPDPQGGAAYG